MKKGLFFILMLLSVVSYAQKVAIKKVELAGEKIIVHYDLEDSNPDNDYQIALYSSQSNFVTALTKVTGDVGNEVKPGVNKKIEWRVREELGPYKGKISLEIRGKQYVALAKFTNITSATKLKRGKNHTITWKPGSTGLINVELYNGSQRIINELNHPNNGSFTLSLPKKLSKGKGYTVRISDSKNPIEHSSSQPFAVVPKIPLLVKLLPIAAVGGAAVALAGGGSETPDNSIPLPSLPEN